MTTTTKTIAHPDIVTRDEWLAARKALLDKEKAYTHEGDAISAERRRLPMVELDKDYRFVGPDGEVSLLDLFGGRRQLVVYHFMFDPEWEEGCPRGVEGLTDAYSLLDRTPYGRQEDFEDSPPGWPQKPTYG